ncbi:MAG TPA: hypothetical protein VIT89_00225 [Solirubrobacterales bacterium]
MSLSPLPFSNAVRGRMASAFLGLALLAILVPSAASAEPPFEPNDSLLTEASAATSPSPDPSCIAIGTAIPKMMNGGPLLSHPGDRKSQIFGAAAEYAPLPDLCANDVRRKPRIRFQIQRSEPPFSWINAGGFKSPIKPSKVEREEREEKEREREEHGSSCLEETPAGKTNICRVGLHIGDAGGIGSVYWRPFLKLHEPTYSRHDPRLYSCSPGRRVTRVRATFQNTVFDNAGKVLARKTAIVPVRVKSYPAGSAIKTWRGAVYGPC